MQGVKPDEVLEVSLKLPFAPGAEANTDKSKEGNTQPGKQSQATGGALLGKQRPGLGGLGTLLPRPRFTSPAAPLLAPQNPGLDGQSGSNANDGGHFVLRCGNLLMSAEVQLQSPCPACTQTLPGLAISGQLTIQRPSLRFEGATSTEILAKTCFLSTAKNGQTQQGMNLVQDVCTNEDPCFDIRVKLRTQGSF